MLRVRDAHHSVLEWLKPFRLKATFGFREGAERGYGHVVFVSPVMIQRCCVPSMTLNCSYGTVGCKQKRCDESTLIQVGWKWDFIEKNTLLLPNSGLIENNLLDKSENMARRRGMKVLVCAEEVPVDS